MALVAALSGELIGKIYESFPEKVRGHLTVCKTLYPILLNVPRVCVAFLTFKTEYSFHVWSDQERSDAVRGLMKLQATRILLKIRAPNDIRILWEAFGGSPDHIASLDLAGFRESPWVSNGNATMRLDLETFGMLMDLSRGSHLEFLDVAGLQRFYLQADRKEKKQQEASFFWKIDEHLDVLRRACKTACRVRVRHTDLEEVCEALLSNTSLSSITTYSPANYRAASASAALVGVLLSHAPRLKEFSAPERNGDLEYSAVCRALEKCDNLEALDLSGLAFPDLGWDLMHEGDGGECDRALSGVINASPALEHLTMHGMSKFLGLGIINISKALQGVLCLRSLKIDSPSMNPNDLPLLTSALKEQPGLRILTMKGNKMFDGANSRPIYDFADALAGMRLQELQLRGTALGHLGAKALSDRFLQRCSSLHTLDVSRNGLKDAAVVAIANALRSHVGMKSLMILDQRHESTHGPIDHFSSLGPEAGHAFVEMMRVCTRLDRIDVEVHFDSDRMPLTQISLLDLGSRAEETLRISCDHLGNAGCIVLANVLSAYHMKFISITLVLGTAGRHYDGEYYAHRSISVPEKLMQAIVGLGLRRFECSILSSAAIPENETAVVQCMIMQTSLSSLKVNNFSDTAAMMSLARNLPSLSQLENFSIETKTGSKETQSALGQAFAKSIASLGSTLESLHLSKMCFEDSQLPKALKSLTKLKRLELGSSMLSLDEGKRLEKFIQDTGWPNLVIHLNELGKSVGRGWNSARSVLECALDHGEPGIESSWQLALYLRLAPPDLRTISLSNLDLHKKEHASLVEDCLRSQGSVSDLSLHACHLGEVPSSASILGVLGRMTSLTRLSLSGNGLTGAEGCAILVTCLKGTTCLQSLVLDKAVPYKRGGGRGGIANTIASSQELISTLERNKTLSEISCSGNKMGPEGMEEFAAAMNGAAEALTSLCLDGNQGGAKGAKALAKIMGRMTNLTNLDLQDNDFGPNGVKLLLPGFKKLRTLRKLHFGRNGIDNTPSKKQTSHELRVTLRRCFDSNINGTTHSSCRIVGVLHDKYDKARQEREDIDEW